LMAEFEEMGGQGFAADLTVSDLHSS
jgi:hypothetical protein